MNKKLANHTNLLQAVLGDYWLLNQQDTASFLSLVNTVLHEDDQVIEKFSNELSMQSPYALYGNDDTHFPLSDAPIDSIALFQITGMLTKYDSWYRYGTETMGNWIKQADQLDNIKAIVLKVDSSGGQVKGIQEFSRIIAACSKPVVAFVDGEACSAAYFAITGANHIKLSGDIAMVGSIGTQLTAIDSRAALEKYGYKLISVYASKSVDKNKDQEELLKGNPEPIISNYLNPINDVFTDTVIQLRDEVNTKKEDVTTGKVYMGQKAIDVGLADSMGTLQEAIQLARQLADELAISQQQQHSIHFNQNNSMSFLKKILGNAEAKAKKEGKELSDEELEQEVNQQLDTLQQENDTLKNQLKQSNESIAANQKRLEELTQKQNSLEQTNKELLEENKKLGKQTIADPVQTSKDKDDFQEEQKQVPMLDIEQKVIDRGIKVDNQSFQRTRGIIL
ncbi:S49 family peptidase [Chondrinema litorale]|uniref:S49 family peptidase n=1 Tax=Chondrinema litorale TaxID=2994555 RepID=UPI00254340FC|nr:S49 family peptidase [Chondrinema litorale]UZR93157.1 S49 family peptidase [Chondrinema litorale]